MTIKRGFRFNPFFNANGAMLEDNGIQGRDTARQWEARPREGGHTIQHRHARGENGRKGETRPWERGHANTGTCGEMEDKGKQGGDVDTPCTKGKQKGTHGETDLGKVDIPSNTGTHMWKQGETRPRADIPSQAHMWGKTSGRRALRGNG